MFFQNVAKTVSRIACALTIVVLAVMPSCDRRTAPGEYADPPPLAFLPKVDPNVSWDNIALSQGETGHRGDVASMTYRTSDLETREKQIAFMTLLKDAAVEEVNRRNTSNVLKKAELSTSEAKDEVKLILEAGSYRSVARFIGHTEAGARYIVVHENRQVGQANK